MIITLYILKEFFKRLAIIISLTLIISVSIGGIELMLNCKNCGIDSIKKPLYLSILFVESSIFFIIITAVVWLTATLSRTNQFIIIAIYSNKKTIILKSAIYAMAILSFTYLLIFNSLVTPHIRNYISSGDGGENHTIEKLWISTLSTENDSASGSIYFMKNARKYLDGYLLDSLSVYKINAGYLTSYEKLSKPFLTTDNKKNLVLEFIDKGGKTAKRIENDILINDVELEFKRESHQNNIGFVKSAMTLMQNHGVNYKDKMQAQIVCITAIETIAMFFLGIILPMCEFPPYNQRFDSGVRGRILRVLIFSIMCYTSLEILKIVGGGEVGSYLASLACCVALLFIFLSRLIKHHH